LADRNIERTSDDCKATGLTRRKLLNSPITLAAGAWTIARTAEAFDGASLASGNWRNSRTKREVDSEFASSIPRVEKPSVTG